MALSPSFTGRPQAAQARGRATLTQSYDRYTPRILNGGAFYATSLFQMIQKEDWQGLKRATSDPPKKTKEDRAKADGGVAERAAKAGEFSDAKVLVAADLYASAFSDSTISSKTKDMRAQVAVLREVVSGINSAALEALGEGGGGGGGLFGIGGSKRSESELLQEVKSLYVKGGNAWNKYIMIANEGKSPSLTALPYLNQ